MTVQATFLSHAAHFVPGVVYNLNIADFKRRNMHLGHDAGDRDIAELDAAVKRLADATGAFAMRTDGDTWRIVSRQAIDGEVRTLIAAFEMCEPCRTGWRVDASRGDEQIKAERVVASQIRRSVRCICAPVKSADVLSCVLKQIDENDWNLPPGRIIALADIPSMKRAPWTCVPRYPDGEPACPFCGGTAFDWKDGDGAIYTGWGTCKACHADVSITQIDGARDQAGSKSSLT